MADGGDGTVELFVDSGAQARTVLVHDPLGRIVEARFAIDGDRAIVEMAGASGLTLLRAEERDPWRADTRGTGELIAAALDAGAREIVVGIGGSATNDAGVGFLRALGARIDPPQAVHGIERIDLSAIDVRLRHARLVVASDVDNPLCGPSGASRMFGAQKGAKPSDLERLDKELARTADAMALALGRDLRNEPGAGAAGGLGFALLAVGATIRPGVDVVAEIAGLPEALKGARLCLTGEGAIDAQTLRGKTVAGVGRYAARAGVPVIAFAGSLDIAAEAALRAAGIVCAPVTPRPMTLQEALGEAEALLEAAAARALALWVLR